MKRAKKLLYLILAGCFLAASLSAAKEFTGEVSVKGAALDDSPGSIYRLREYRSMPKDGSLSGLLLNRLWSGDENRFSFFGVGLFEDDVDTGLLVGLKDYLTYEGSYEKITHLLAPGAGSGFFTEREIETHRVYLFPLGSVRGEASISEEAKTGRLATSNYAGNINDTKSIYIQGEAERLLLALGFSNEDFSESNFAHDTDNLTASLRWTPTDRCYNLFSYGKTEYDPAMTNAAGTLELRDFDAVNTHRLSTRMTMTTSYSNQERANETAGAVSFEDKLFSTSIDYVGRLARAGVTYKKADRDFTGADITARDTETLEFKGSYRTRWLKFKLDYAHGSRDVAGVSNVSLINYDELSGETYDQNFSVQLLGHKKYGLTYYVKRKARKHSPYALYGTTSQTSRNSGFSSVFHAYDNLTFTLNFYTLENRMEGRQKFWVADPVSGLVSNLDTTYGIYNSSDHLQVGGTYMYAPDTLFYLDYYQSVSNLSDPHRVNRATEKTLTLTVDQELSNDYTMDIGYTWNTYHDDLDTAYSNRSHLYEIELTRKF